MDKSLAQLFSSALSLFSFCSQVKEGDPGIEIDQEFVITCWKLSWSNQSGLKRKGMGPRVASKKISSRIGLWSEVLLGRILDVANKPEERKSEWMRNLSRQAAM